MNTIRCSFLVQGQFCRMSFQTREELRAHVQAVHDPDFFVLPELLELPPWSGK